MYIKCEYCTVWDGGIEIITNCMYNPLTKDVTDIESVDANGLDCLEEEYILLEDGTRIDREDFTIDGEPNEY